jgi:melanoma-associated antigen p97
MLDFRLFVISISIIICVTQKISDKNKNLKTLARWCCVNSKEFDKCENWKIALLATNQSSILFECIQASDKFECFRRIFEDQADLMTADAGDIYTAGKYYNLVPISSEVYSSQVVSGAYSDIYSVALVKKKSKMNIGKLRGSNSCHGGIGTSAGWNVPISTLIEMKQLDVIDCNNHVKAATNYFNKMCAPDALNVQFNPTGDNPTSVCELCIGKIGSTFCTNQDPYSGYIGAIYCLNDGGGDVAFVTHNALNELASYNRTINLEDYELLCPNFGQKSGEKPSTAHINSYLNCNWGKIPGRAILTSSRKAIQQRNDYKTFLKQSAKLFSGKSPSSIAAFYVYQPQITTTTKSMLIPWLSQNIDPYFFNVPAELSSFKYYLFDSTAFGGRDLIFIDQTTSFQDIDNNLNYVSYLNSKCKLI